MAKRGCEGRRVTSPEGPCGAEARSTRLDRVGLTWKHALVAAVMCGLPSCGDDDTSPGEPPDEDPPSDEGCAPGTTPVGEGECEPAGLPADMPCAPGERQHGDGCRAAGMEPEDCEEGFEHDGQRRCEAVLPAESCAEGTMAVPGDPNCREVAPCGSGTWGDIVTDASTQHVDASYVLGDSDGTVGKPWPTIQQGVDAANANGLVAVAAGVYLEDVSIDTPVRIEGRCPSMVAIEGQAAAAVVALEEGSDGSRVARLSISGPWRGIRVSSQDVELEALWVHDQGNTGLSVLPGGSASVEASLFERNATANVLADASAMTIDSCVLRDARSDSDGWGEGLIAEGGATLLLQRSVVETSFDVGVRVQFSSADLEGTLIRDNRGRGVRIRGGPGSSIIGSVVHDNGMHADDLGSGIYIRETQATVERTVVRSNHGIAGVFVGAQENDQPGNPADVDLDDSVIEGNESAGIYVHYSTLRGAGLRVRDQVPHPDDGYGFGVYVWDSEVSLLGTAVERNRFAGVVVIGELAEAELTLEDSVVSDTGRAPSIDASLGILANAYPAPTSVSLLRSRVENNGGPGLAADGAAASLSLVQSEVAESQVAGILMTGATGSLERTLVRDTMPNDAQLFGDGIVAAVHETGAPATLRVVDSRIEASSRAALAVFGSELEYGGTALSCQAFDIVGEQAGGVASSVKPLERNGCGCPEVSAECLLESPGLSPPQPVEAIP